MIKRLKREFSIFKNLGRDTYLLILSNFSQAIAGSLIFIFANAYMFTRTEDLRAVGVFNLGFFITMIMGFFANAFLLKKFSVRTIFAPSLVMQGASILALLFITNLTLYSIFSVGLIYGFFLGLYWANRNFIFTVLTTDNNRDYIMGLNSFVASLSGVVLPVTAGWFIVWAESRVGFGSDLAYKIIVLFGVSILFLGSLLLMFIDFPEPKIKKIFLSKKPSKDWILFRWFAFLVSAQFVAKLTLPEVLTLSYIGNEGALGTIMSFLSLMVGIVMYFVGRKMKKDDRWKVLLLGHIPLFLIAVVLLFSFSPTAVIIYLMATSLANTVFWFIYFSIFAKLLEMQGDGKLENNYAYILDHEVISNISRIIFVLLFFFILSRSNSQVGLTIYIFLAAFVQLVALSVGRKLLLLQKNSN